MYKKPRHDFNDKARLYLYTVGVILPQTGNGDAHTQSVIAAIERLAGESPYAGKIRLTPDDGALRAQGIFFMSAPATFAAEIRAMDGIRYVEPPSARAKKTEKSRKPRQPS